MTGTSTSDPEFRKPPVDARRLKDPWELTLELLPEMLMQSRRRRVPAVTAERIYVSEYSVKPRPYPLRARHLPRTGVVPRKYNELSSPAGLPAGFFCALAMSDACREVCVVVSKAESAP